MLGAYGVMDVQVSRAITRGLVGFVAVENIFDQVYDTGRTPIRLVGWPRTFRVGRARGVPLTATPRTAAEGGPMIDATHGVVLFDGTCGFCEGSVRFIARRDRDAYFRFAPSQWPQAQEALAKRGLTREAARSLVLIEGDQVYLRSTASLKIAARLPWPWKAAQRAALGAPAHPRLRLPHRRRPAASAGGAVERLRTAAA